jgi:hypothetical protein
LDPDDYSNALTNLYDMARINFGFDGDHQEFKQSSDAMRRYCIGVSERLRGSGSEEGESGDPPWVTHAFRLLEEAISDDDDGSYHGSSMSVSG